MAPAARQMLEVETRTAVADGGYDAEAQAAQCEKVRIEVYMPRPQARERRSGRRSGTFLLRGVRKVRGEFSSSVLVDNLQRVLNPLPAAPMTAALERMRAGVAVIPSRRIGLP